MHFGHFIWGQRATFFQRVSHINCMCFCTLKKVPPPSPPLKFKFKLKGLFLVLVYSIVPQHIQQLGSLNTTKLKYHSCIDNAVRPPAEPAVAALQPTVQPQWWRRWRPRHYLLLLLCPLMLLRPLMLRPLSCPRTCSTRRTGLCCCTCCSCCCCLSGGGGNTR